MAEYDKALGQRVSTALINLGIETPMSPKLHIDKMSSRDTIELCQYRILASLGLDTRDDSISGTPRRVTKMYCDEIFSGLDYDLFPKCTTVENKARYDEVISVRGADVLSVCEHHFIPFIGHADVAYIPSTKILGLSKFNRVVDFFSRRPQIQERLTLQIYAALSLILETEDVAVVIKAEHFCVRLRGVKQQSETITSKMGGRFMSKPELREEFLTLTR